MKRSLVVVLALAMIALMSASVLAGVKVTDPRSGKIVYANTLREALAKFGITSGITGRAVGGQFLSPENTPSACPDGIDNDGDTLIDCLDPECGCAALSTQHVVLNKAAGVVIWQIVGLPAGNNFANAFVVIQQPPNVVPAVAVFNLVVLNVNAGNVVFGDVLNGATFTDEGDFMLTDDGTLNINLDDPVLLNPLVGGSSLEISISADTASGLFGTEVQLTGVGKNTWLFS